MNDVNALTPLLARNEDNTPNFDCRSSTSGAKKIDRREMLALIDALLAPGAEVGLFYFAGHGSPTKDDVILVAQDGTERDPGVSLSEILAKVQASTIREIIIILDCCFSGAAGGLPQLGSNVAVLRPGVALLSASRGNQTASEAGGRGLFSTYLGVALCGGAADTLGKVTLAGVYAYLAESFGTWDQRPAFKANLENLHELRLCAPAVPLSELRRLPELFKEAAAAFQLDRSYEPTAEPRHAEHEATFALLQRCRAGKLVEPVGTEHMYFAAMESKTCRLTPLGQHYWRIAKQGRL